MNSNRAFVSRSLSCDFELCGYCPVSYFFAAAYCCAAESQLTTFHHALM